jgi:hypothetical protein
VRNGDGAWPRSFRARRRPDSEAQLKEREVGRGSSTWSRGRRQWRWAAAIGTHTQRRFELLGMDCQEGKE